MRKCVVCSTELVGKQRRFCGNTCKKRAQRHPELYAATPSNPVVQVTPGSVYKAASTGDTRQGLEALRGKLAMAIDACEDSKELAQLSTRLVEVLSKLDMLASVEQKGSKLDELNERRARRRAREAS